MATGFNTIPGNLRAPIIAFEINSGGQFESVSRLLLVGHKNSGASAVDNVPVRCNSVNEAIALTGRGSMLAEMMIASRRNAPAQDIWLLPVPATGTAEVRTLTVGTVPAAGGVGTIAIDGEQISLTIGAGDTAASVATALAASINAYQDALTKSALPFTASAATNVVTLTARNAGEVYSGVDIYVPSVSTGNVFTTLLTIATGTAGAGTPNLAAGLAALGDDPFDWIVSPFADDANMGRYQTLLSDVSGRWAWNRQSYGHVFVPKTDTTANLTTFGLAYDTRHVTVLPRIAGGGDGTNPWVWAASVAARAVPWLSDGETGNVSRNQTGLVVEGVLAPRDRTRWMNDYATRDAFIGSGLSTFGVRSDGAVTIDKLVTLQRTDGAGNVDTTFRDLQKIGQLVYTLRLFRARLQAEHGQKAIADDNPGNLLAVTTVADIRATMAAAYRSMPGVVENAEEFAARLDVRRNGDNPNRVDIFAPLDMVNPLDIIAANATIYSQYPALAA
ncbi:hypothetical protein LA66_07010 [Aureimonas altamirensis]|uniref:Tail sheath protein subtilisin-like domain-containing protein n=1 Tax=Aureimonas altamirensis TaxID=370622 RepID=A0A0B1QBI9_9HYPH|nr:phage tail sheath subtilisin-like domain-containing protein [Aureimonas altamirensis]KHJ56302.1 hypothetical protein LA66_07010 [Aureimonas altamirensis]